jgi:uncharacterized damage-inducible protein DinB
MLNKHFRAMARNNAWSNHRLLQACARLSDEEYRAERVSFFPSIHLTLNHILLVDWYYLDALERGGRGLEVSEIEQPCADLTRLCHEQSAADRRLIAYCDRLTGQHLSEIVVLERPANVRNRERVQDVLAHLFVHQIHHRGQVHAMLAGTSMPPPQLDEFFLGQDAALRAGDLAALGFLEKTAAGLPHPTASRA